MIKTNFETYSIHQDAQGGSIQLDDSLIIERNVFGKPIYYSKIGSKFKFSLPIDDRYYLLLFLTFLSFLLLKFRFQYNIVCLVLISCFNILLLPLILPIKTPFQMRLKRSLTDEERNKLRKFLFLREKADREEEDRDNETFKKKWLV